MPDRNFFEHLRVLDLVEHVRQFKDDLVIEKDKLRVKVVRLNDELGQLIPLDSRDKYIKHLALDARRLECNNQIVTITTVIDAFSERFVDVLEDDK